MITTHKKQLIIEQYPTGFSFEPNALRLVEGKIGYMPSDIELAKMKQEMFRRQDGVYFFCEQVADEETREEIENTAEEWIRSFGCFALEALQKKYEQKIKNVSNVEDFGGFLEKLHFPLEAYQNVWYDQNKKIRITRPVGVNRELVFAKLIQCIKKIIDEKFSATDYEIIERIPALNNELLVAVVKDKMTQVIRTENNGTICFQFAENYLPDDLSEKIREAVEKIEKINMQVTPETLHLMLSSIYQTNFNETYSIPDMREFNKIIKQYSKEIVQEENQYHESEKLQPSKTIQQTMSHSKAGRPIGTGKFGGCETKVIRVPTHLVSEISNFIEKLSTNNGDLSELDLTDTPKPQDHKKEKLQSPPNLQQTMSHSKAGRPKGTGKFGCETKVIRVPVHLIPKIFDFIKKKLEDIL